MNKFLPGFGTAMGLVMLLIILSYVGVVNLPLLYPVRCETQAGNKIGTVVLRTDPGKSTPKVFCRVD